MPGGSSGGSAAAVPLALTSGCMGTDTGGSVRQPASFCGVTGIKTDLRRVSRYGLVAYGSSLDSVGVLAQTLRISALMFNHMAGFDPVRRDQRKFAACLTSNSSGSQFARLKELGYQRNILSKACSLKLRTAVRTAIAQWRSGGGSDPGQPAAYRICACRCII